MYVLQLDEKVANKNTQTRKRNETTRRFYGFVLFWFVLFWYLRYCVYIAICKHFEKDDPVKGGLCCGEP